MNLLLKKHLSIVFLLIFFYSLIGFYPAFVIRKYNIRKNVNEKIHENLPGSEIIQIKYTADIRSKIQWKGENEFLLEEQMYDIISQDTGKDGQKIFYCLIDKEEKQLMDDFDFQVQSNTDTKTSGNHSANILEIYSLDYLKPEKSVFSNFPVNLEYLSFKGNFYLSLSPENLSPPPEIS